MSKCIRHRCAYVSQLFQFHPTTPGFLVVYSSSSSSPYPLSSSSTTFNLVHSFSLFSSSTACESAIRFHRKTHQSRLFLSSQSFFHGGDNNNSNLFQSASRSDTSNLIEDAIISAAHRDPNIGRPKSITNIVTGNLSRPMVNRNGQILPHISGTVNNTFSIPNYDNQDFDHVARHNSIRNAIQEFQTGNRPFTVLGIETSCDDTAAAVVTSTGKVLAEVVVSQVDVHQGYGGVVPNLAKSAHEEAIDRVVDESLKRAGSEIANGSDKVAIDAVAVTMGPGLELCLRVGFQKAKQLAAEWNVPFVAVNHLEAHALMVRQQMKHTFPSEQGGLSYLTAAQQINENTVAPFPYLTLLVSGGHCQLILVLSTTKYCVIGGTLDDALGEAFDKTARLLGLPIGGGGGPALEKLAATGDPNNIPLTIPMRRKRNCNFSFAGLKTSVKKFIERQEQNPESAPVLKEDIAAAFQLAAFTHVIDRLKITFEKCCQLAKRHDQMHGTDLSLNTYTTKDDMNFDVEEANEATIEAMAKFAQNPHLRNLVVAGGVAANKVLRSSLEDVVHCYGWNLVLPPPHLCTDNGVMVAWAGIERLQKGISDDPENMDVRARWPLGPLLSFDEL